MISFIFGVGFVAAGFAGVIDTSSIGAMVQPSSWSTLDTSSMGSYVQPVMYTNSYVQPSTYGYESLEFTSPTTPYTAIKLDTSSMGSVAFTSPTTPYTAIKLDTSSMGSGVQQPYAKLYTQPAFKKSWSALDTSSMSSFVQQPVLYTKSYVQPLTYGYASMESASTTNPYTAIKLDTSSMGSFVQQPYVKSYVQPAPTFQKSWSALDTSSMGTFVEQPAQYTTPVVQPSMYGHARMESASATNPYNINKLDLNVAPLTVQASKVMPVKHVAGGVKHVVGNDLQMHVNHEADKTIHTKRLVHHSPVVHKTVRTHQFAEDVVHDKQIHHMNVVEDRQKHVKGKEYIGTKQQVDHTTVNPPTKAIVKPSVKMYKPH